MEYEVAFEIERNGLGVLWYPLVGLLCAGGVFAFTEYFNRYVAVGATRFIPSFRIAIIGFILLWTIGAFLVVGPSQSKLRQSYEEGRFEVVEGVVENFNSNPRGRNDNEMESFSVNDHFFEYNYFEPSPSFNHTAYHGGPVKEGMQVKVTYIGDVIVKLEVAVRANK